MGGIDYSHLREYIEKQWDTLLVSDTAESETHLGLPHPFVAPSTNPSDGFVFKDQFYWDTYFTVVGLVEAGRVETAKGMVDNLADLFNQLGYIPNSNNRHHLGRSQPPLFTQAVRAVYAAQPDQRWLESMLNIAEKDYFQVWRSHDKEVLMGLSRYYNQADPTHRGAEDESGWDYTTRFRSEAMDYLPIDLNAMLYGVERDIAWMNQTLGHSDDEWAKRAHQRARVASDLMWDDQAGLYFDFNYKTSQKSDIKSLASYVPLFTHMVNPKRARVLANSLQYFETDSGLSTTDLNDAASEGKQWAAPNGWAPLHFMSVVGLEKYGLDIEAHSIAQKWLRTVNTSFHMHKTIFEKYNVVNPNDLATSAMYPDQHGFGWTNAVTLYFLNKFN